MTPLTETTVIDYARRRGLLAANDSPRVELLSGGVAGRVFRVGDQFVIKQAEEKFRVKETWIVDPRRNWLEAQFQALARQSLGPAHVPEVLDVDRENFCFTMAAAPRDARNWKTMMLAGDVRPELGAQCRQLLDKLHAIPPPDFLRDTTLFYQQRIEPYFEFILPRYPELAAIIELLNSRHEAVTHGDYTPKNFLVSAGTLILLDYEVGHIGWPEFDFASIVNHLTLKMIHLPARRPALRATLEDFLDGRPVHLPLVGALMLARVDGKSPAEYLRKDEKMFIRDAGRKLLHGDHGDLTSGVNWPVSGS